jgi:hypothetical protein
MLLAGPDFWRWIGFKCFFGNRLACRGGFAVSLPMGEDRSCLGVQHSGESLSGPKQDIF